MTGMIRRSILGTLSKFTIHCAWIMDKYRPPVILFFRLAIEFKYLMKNAPGGVYIIPEFDNIRRLHGVIFVRKGDHKR